MAQIILDFSSITPEQIKEATAVLQKEITTQVNDAMSKGLTGSLDRYSRDIAKSVSGALRDSLLKVVEVDIAKGFEKAFNSVSLASGLSDSLKKSIEEAFKSLPAFTVDIKPVIKPENKLMMRDVFDEDPQSVLQQVKGTDRVVKEEPKSDIIITDRDVREEEVASSKKGLGGIMPLPLYEVGRDTEPSKASIEKLFQSFIKQDVPKPEAREMAERFAESPMVQDTDFEDSKQVALLREFNKAINTQSFEMKGLSEQLEGLTEVTEDLEDATRKSAEIAEKDSRLSKIEKPPGPDPTKKLVDWTDSFRLTVGMWLTSIPRVLLGVLKETVLSFKPRQREATTAVASVVGSDEMLRFFDVYQKHMSEIDTALKHDPLLQAYGGENAKESYLGLKGVTGGVGIGEVVEGVDVVAVEMKGLAAKALLAGMNLDDFATKVKEGITALGLSQDISEKFIISVADRAKELNISFDSLYSNVNSANGSIRQWGHSLYEAYGISSRFARSLEQGRMAMGDIVEFAAALHGTEEGTSVFLMDQLSRVEGMGGDIARAVREASGGDPMIERNLWRRVSEGHPGMAKELGLGISDAQMQKDFRTSIFKMIDQMVEGIAGENVYAQAEVRRKLLQQFLGIAGNLSEVAFEDIHKVFGEGGTARGFVPRGTREVEDKAEEAKERMDRDLGTFESVTLTGKNVIVNVVDAIRGIDRGTDAKLSMLDSALTGLREKDDESYALGRKYLEERGGLTHPPSETLLGVLDRMATKFEGLAKSGDIGRADKLIELLPLVIPPEYQDEIMRHYQNFIKGQITNEDIRRFNTIVEKVKEQVQYKKMTGYSG